MGVVRFCVTADENVNDFYEYVFFEFDYGPTWRSVLDRYLNQLIDADSGEICCPQPSLQLQQAVSMERSYVTVEMFPLINLTINESNNSVALVTDDNPWGYQAIFFNIPTVTGDIVILLLIIIVLTALVGSILWCCQRYLFDPRASRKRVYDEKARG